MSRARSMSAAAAALISIAAVAGVTRASWAQPPEAVTLAQVLELVRERSPGAAAERASIEVAEAETVEARIRPNPTLSYGYASTLRGADSIGGMEHSLSVDIPILMGKRIRARVALADRAVTAARADVAASLAERARDAAQVYAALAAAEARVSVIEQAVIDTENIERVIVGRAASGASSRYHVERMALELSGLRTRLDELRAERDDLGGLLARLAGLPGWTPRVATALAPLGVATGGAAEAEAALRLPALEAAHSREQAAAAAVDVALTERRPIPEITVGAFATTDPHGVAGVLGLSVPLPIFDKAQGMVARARAEARAARLVREAVAAESQAELVRARRLVDSRRTALGTFEDGAVSRLTSLRAMAEQAYVQGQSGIGELLDTLEAIVDMRLDHVGLIEALLLAEIEYLAAAGRLHELR